MAQTLEAAKLLLLISLAVWLVQTRLKFIRANQMTGTLNESINYVAHECNQKLIQLDSMVKFETFMDHYERVVSELEKPKRGFLSKDKNLRQCFDLKEQLRSIQRILSNRNTGICRMSFIDQLIEFHSKYVATQNNDQQQVTNSKFTKHIFSLIAHQVAYTCKSKLIGRLVMLQTKSNCLEVVASFLPESAFIEPTLDDQANSEAESSTAEHSLHDFLANFKRVEDLALVLNLPSEGAQSLKEPYFEVLVSNQALNFIQELKSRCRQREPHYLALFEPIVSLNQLGYQIPADFNGGALDPANEKEERILRCWLATAQLCQGILRTHINTNKASDEGHDVNPDQLDQKKLVQIKFGQVPVDVELPMSEATRNSELVNLIGDSFEDISPKIIELVKRQSSFKGKMKRKMLTWAKKFVERHIDIDAMRNENARKFMEALTRDEDQTDSSVAFNGKKRDHGVYLSSRVITDDADSIIQSTSLFLHKGVALVVSSVVAICMSAVLVYFTLYALVTAMRKTKVPDATGNFKESWRQMRDQRMKTIDDKVKRKGWKDPFMVYRSKTG